MSDIRPFLKKNRLNQIKENIQSYNDHLNSILPNPEPLPPIDIETIHNSCVSDAARMIEYLDPKLQEGQSAFERHVDAIEKIANEAKNQSVSSSKIADSAKIQADTALRKSKEADIKGWIAIIISLIALFIEIAVNYVEIINFIKLFI